MRTFLRRLLGVWVIAAALLSYTTASKAMWPDDVDLPQSEYSPTSSVAHGPAPTPVPAGVTRPADRPTAVYYTVRAGDSLWQISRRFGITVSVIATVNGFNGTKVLREGMELYLPYSNEVGTARYGAGGPVAKGPGLHFVASVEQQTCWLFRDGAIQERWICSTGRPGSPSIPGNYTVQTKMPRAYSNAADFWMPAWLGIYEAGVFENGIHGIPYRAGNGERLWTDLVGTPITYGCVMLEDALAQRLYQLAYVGMPVTVLP